MAACLSCVTLAVSVLLWSSVRVHAAAVETGDFIRYNDLNGQPYTVSYDERSFIINGKRSILLGGSVHYPRLSPAQWPAIMSKALDDGLNHLEVYVFWNVHEPAYDFSGKHVYNYEGRANITQFLEAAKNGGMFIDLRIGPYICAEWSFGGVPTWILHDEDVLMRSSNANWQKYMKSFVDEISDVVRPYLAKNGGPIIMAQIENEYHGNDTAYVNWCGQLAASQNFSVPWIMCNGESANNTVNTCNGVNCYNKYVPSHATKFPGQPLAWTENEGWSQFWGREYNANATETDNRTPADMAQSVAAWFGAGAAHHNYYMWMGGNHVKNFAGSSITNYYADGVNFHADGLPHEPKKSHLMKLHQILAEHNRALMETPKQYGNEQYIVPVGQTQSNNQTFAYVYTATDGSKDQLTFLMNLDSKQYTLPWNGQNYELPANSVSLTDYEGTELYNTAKVSTAGLPTERVNTVLYSGDTLSWCSYSEPLPLTASNAAIRPDKGIFNQTPLEQIRLTNDTYEYVIYSANYTLQDQLVAPANLSFTGQAANAYVVYIDGEYMASTANYEHASKTVQLSVSIGSSDAVSKGDHVLTVISSSLGIDNAMQAEAPPDAMDKKGLTGNVSISDTNSGGHTVLNLTAIGWTHYIGLTGERLQVYGSGENKVNWTSPAEQSRQMTWFKTTFKTPSQSVLDGGVILVDIGDSSQGVNRGHFYVNGYDMGHFNDVEQNGLMVQQFYFVPTDYLTANSGVNTLLFMDEWDNDGDGRDLKEINIVSSTMVVPS
eukprot:CAMPEP_0197021954 /NCGR_PEP_ID=MMETSP1384-20130603/2836_1 /TAXON_ID=29189 /ORGANISM="Ammonia sp." /LENGTH=773 /DNA_ID=CAMNT_0042449895 /DNA_START=51 /DNA_END=2372 /DNA_ORIENTATION=-